MAVRLKDSTLSWKAQKGMVGEELDRVNARLRHFRGVAACVMSDALEIWGEIWDASQDHRSCEDILADFPGPRDHTPSGEWAAYLEKLHLLGTYIDYAKRLCEGSIDQQIHHESEVEGCPDSSQSFQTASHPSITRFCRPKKK